MASILVLLIKKLQSVQNSAACLLRRKEGLGNVSTVNYIKKHRWLCEGEDYLHNMLSISYLSA